MLLPKLIYNGSVMIWYRQNTEQLFEILNTGEDGISSSEAKSRLRHYGLNQPSIKKPSIWKAILEPFKDVFVIVLLVAALISFLSREYIDATIIMIIIVVNAGIYYSQQYATTRVLRNLKKRNIHKVNVIRDGKQQPVVSTALVPGDIVVIGEGERIYADIRIVYAENLKIDESSFTGESTPVHKYASTLESNKQVYEQDNMGFQGTYVVSGYGRAVVVETGSRTEFSKITELVADDASDSPVKQKIDQLISSIVKASGVLAVVVFILALARGIPANEALRFVLSMTVSAVPEGLPVALTVVIVLGMRRMAKQKALVRSFRAIEDVGLVTTIATDKTGTLTKNHLTVVDSWSIRPTDIMETASLTVDRIVSSSDPLDKAIIEATEKLKYKKIDKLYPFDISLRMSGAYIADHGLIYIKGSPEHILVKSNLKPDQHSAAESTMHDLAAKGYRVIAFGTVVAKQNLPDDLGSIKKGDIKFVGYLAFADELRKEAKAAIKAALDAGISVRLITGDHYETAYNIGKQIGLANRPSQVVQGTDLPSNHTALSNVVINKTVFARILPEDKYRILKALKRTEITAMTGDGVNDVPAIVDAHVGISMGSGSDVAKDASGIILLDDNFATIIKAIAEGRRIFDNIRRMLFYLLATALGEIFTMICALLVGLPLPVTAIQILWINLVTDTAMVLPLGLEPEEDGYMKRKPRRPKDPLLSNTLAVRMVIVAMTMAIVTLSAVVVMMNNDYTESQIQTVAFMMLIAAQWTNAFNARSEHKSSFSRFKKMNYWMLFGFVVAFSLQMLVMFGPLAPILHIQVVPIETLLIGVGIISISVLMVVEIHKVLIATINKRKLNQE
jgi:Ca2+-transporting ATPase